MGAVESSATNMKSCDTYTPGSRQGFDLLEAESRTRLVSINSTHTYIQCEGRLDRLLQNGGPASFSLCPVPPGLCIRLSCPGPFVVFWLSPQAEALDAERATTVAFLEPLKTQLRDLEDQLKESSMKIDGVKAGISANDKKINSLLKMMVTS